jgi:hypothetical protein
MNDDIEEPTPLPSRNAMHYDDRGFERVDWSQRGAHMKREHGSSPALRAVTGDPDSDARLAQHRQALVEAVRRLTTRP